MSRRSKVDKPGWWEGGHHCHCTAEAIWSQESRSHVVKLPQGWLGCGDIFIRLSWLGLFRPLDNSGAVSGSQSHLPDMSSFTLSTRLGCDWISSGRFGFHIRGTTFRENRRLPVDRRNGHYKIPAATTKQNKKNTVPPLRSRHAPGPWRPKQPSKGMVGLLVRVFGATTPIPCHSGLRGE